MFLTQSEQIFGLTVALESCHKYAWSPAATDLGPGMTDHAWMPTTDTKCL